VIAWIGNVYKDQSRSRITRCVGPRGRENVPAYRNDPRTSSVENRGNGETAGITSEQERTIEDTRFSTTASARKDHDGYLDADKDVSWRAKRKRSDNTPNRTQTTTKQKWGAMTVYGRTSRKLELQAGIGADSNMTVSGREEEKYRYETAASMFAGAKDKHTDRPSP